MRPIAILPAAVFLGAFAAASNAADIPSGPAGGTTNQFLKLKKQKQRHEKHNKKRLSAKKLYQKAQKALHDENYREALEQYDRIQSQYPFSRYASQAQLETVYANYQINKPATAMAAAHRFLREHPRNPNVDYVYYLQGMINFTRVTHQSNHFFGIDGARRDDQYVHRAYQDFANLIQRFPKSRYSGDARQRMIYLKNEMARREWYIAHYYMHRHAWLAANRRARGIVKHFQGTKWVPKALKIMEDSYAQLGMTQAAANVHKIMAANFSRQAKNDKHDKTPAG